MTSPRTSTADPRRAIAPGKVSSVAFKKKIKKKIKKIIIIQTFKNKIEKLSRTRAHLSACQSAC
jgi:hypothetical protein